MDETSQALLPLYETNPLVGAGGLIDGLTDNQQAFLIAKMYGVTDAAAARQCGINEHTMRGWKQHDKEFMAVYEMVTQMPLEMAAKVSAFGFAKAIDKILRLMDAQDIKVVMWAIERMLSIASVGKQRIEVTHREEQGELKDDDFDRIVSEVERRRTEPRTESD